MRLLSLKRKQRLIEAELIRNARNGDNHAFKELVKKYERQVAATVIGMLGHCAEAEDIGQETFIQFYRSLNKFRGESSVGTYLTRIAINLSLNELKRRKRKRRVFISKSDDNIRYLMDTKDSQEEYERKKIVRRGIEKLDPKFQAIIVLRLINGYSTRETARILNLPIGTVLSRLARGQKKLKEILAPLYKGGI